MLIGIIHDHHHHCLCLQLNRINNTDLYNYALPLLLHHLDIAAVPLIDIEFICVLIPVGPAEWLWVDDATAPCMLFWLFDVWSLFDCNTPIRSPFWMWISSASSWSRFHSSSRSRSRFFSLKTTQRVKNKQQWTLIIRHRKIYGMQSSHVTCCVCCGIMGLYFILQNYCNMKFNL